MAKKNKAGRKPKYKEKTVVSSIRHPKSKIKEVREVHANLINKFENE